MLSASALESFIDRHYTGRKPPEPLLAAHRRRIGVRRIPNGGSMASDHRLKDALVFVSDRPNYFFLRLSDSFRRQGIRTVLVTRWGVDAGQARFFDRVLLYDALTDLKRLEKCRNCILYVQSWVGWNILPVYIQAVTGQDVYCNINDLTHLLFDDPGRGDLIGLSPPEMDMDLHCERHILEHFSFVSFPYLPAPIDRIAPGLSRRIDKHLFHFPCYPSQSFFKRPPPGGPPAEPHLLFMGGIPPDKKPDAAFRDAKLQGIVRTLLSLNLRLTVMNNPQMAGARARRAELYPHFDRLCAANGRFRFQDGVPPWRFEDLDRPYSHGLMLYSFRDLVISENHYRWILPSKLFTYAELGLPVMVSEEMEAVSNLVKEHQIGRVVSEDDIRRLDRQLSADAADYQTQRQQMREFRNRFEVSTMLQPFMESHFTIGR